MSPAGVSPRNGWWADVWAGFWTTAVGMRITLKYLFRKPNTVQYPEERMPIPDRYRGIHYLEQEKCIYCFMCARACPVDCISMEAVRHGKELEWVAFTVDYNRCMFCELCTYPCPKDCIHEGKEFALVTYDRKELVLDLLSYKGLSDEAKVRIEIAEKQKAAKEAAKAAKAAKTAAAKSAPAAESSGAATATATEEAKPAKGEKPAKAKDASSPVAKPDGAKKDSSPKPGTGSA